MSRDQLHGGLEGSRMVGWRAAVGMHGPSSCAAHSPGIQPCPSRQGGLAGTVSQTLLMIDASKVAGGGSSHDESNLHASCQPQARRHVKLLRAGSYRRARFVGASSIRRRSSGAGTRRRRLLLSPPCGITARYAPFRLHCCLATPAAVVGASLGGGGTRAQPARPCRDLQA